MHKPQKAACLKGTECFTSHLDFHDQNRDHKKCRGCFYLPLEKPSYLSNPGAYAFGNPARPVVRSLV